MRDKTSYSQGDVLGVDLDLGDDLEGAVHVVVALLVDANVVQGEVARIRRETYLCDIGCGGCRDPPRPGLKLQACRPLDAVVVELPGWFTVFLGGRPKGGLPPLRRDFYHQQVCCSQSEVRLS